MSPGGPYLLAALICEKVLTETDGVQSVIRIIDRITHMEPVEDLAEPMKRFPYQLAFFLLLKAGAARGSRTLEVRFVKPSGESPEPLVQQLYFEGEDDRGVVVYAQMAVEFDMPGVHWFDVLVDNELLTRIPFRVIYMPQLRQRRGTSGA
jgi:hypothetical protein